MLEQKLASYQISPVSKTVEVASAVIESVKSVEEAKAVEVAPASPIGGARLAPVFSTPAVVESPKVEAEPVKLVVETAVLPEVKAVAEAPSIEVKSAPVLVDIPASVPVAPAPKMVVEVPAPAPTPVPAPAPAIPSVPFSDVDANHLNRIREIKSAVNSKVGNPVNLVDIDNAVGREYMNALLDAMKRLSGGVGQVNPAMERLETAFIAVEKAVALHEASKNSTPASVPVTVEEVVVPEAPQPVVIASVPEMLAEEVKSVEAAPQAWAPISQVKEVAAVPAAPSAPMAPAPVSNVESAPVVEVAKEPVIVPTPVTPEPIRQPEPVVVHAAVAPSVLEGARVRTPDELPSPESISTSASGDPLFTREVDDGLEQLLSDWLLFKKSGLFGTGPKGREHPLYKKLSQLQIPHLLAGRFEGSNQEIKQSITDYMNGWRYEQGIIYEQGELFEHYLRRVIKQILDLQKKRHTA